MDPETHFDQLISDCHNFDEFVQNIQKIKVDCIINISQICVLRIDQSNLN